MAEIDCKVTPHLEASKSARLRQLLSLFFWFCFASVLLITVSSPATVDGFPSTSPTEQNEKDNRGLFSDVGVARNIMKEECRDTGKRLCLLLEHDKSHSSQSVCLDSGRVALSFYHGRRKKKRNGEGKTSSVISIGSTRKGGRRRRHELITPISPSL